MEQDMTTSTSATEILKQQQAWTRTSGAATPWIFSSSNVAFVAMPNTSTVPLELTFPVVLGIEWLNVQEPELENQPAKEQLPLFSRDQDPLQHAVLRLLEYEPEPDEPGDQDVEPALGYGFPR
jgi:hypothetical protein